MVSPLGQRQMFQTINTEAVKAASEVSGQLQREAGLRQSILDRMAEDQVSVPEIPKTDAMRTEERKGGRQGQPRQHSDESGGEEDAPDSGSAEPANPAETHMDFLA
jgi:hypothetical protein